MGVYQVSVTGMNILEVYRRPPPQKIESTPVNPVKNHIYSLRHQEDLGDIPEEREDV